MAAAGLVQKWTEAEKAKVATQAGETKQQGSITIKHLQVSLSFSVYSVNIHPHPFPSIIVRRVELRKLCTFFFTNTLNILVCKTTVLFQAAFFLLLMGYLFATLALVVERVQGSKHNSLLHQTPSLPYKEEGKEGVLEEGREGVLEEGRGVQDEND